MIPHQTDEEKEKLQRLINQLILLNDSYLILSKLKEKKKNALR